MTFLNNVFHKVNAKDFLADYPPDFKYAYIIFTAFMCSGGLVWGILACFFAYYQIAVIPFGYVLFSLFNFAYLLHYQNFRLARFLQVFASILLPFLFQWLLGGYIATGAVMLWSFLTLTALLTFYRTREVVVWLVLFLSLLAITFWIDDYSHSIAPIALQNPFTQRILFTVNISLIGSMMFFALRYFIIINRKDKTMNQVLEQQKIEFKEKNEEITAYAEQIQAQNRMIQSINDILDRQKKILEHKNTAWTESINYAQRIQRAAFMNPLELEEYFKDGFIFFKPKDIVSGDFYWFTEVEKNNSIYKILVVADCTGHGVPAALMTLMGQDFLEKAVLFKKIVSPARILYELESKVATRLNSNNTHNPIDDGMDIGVLMIDETNQKIVFAGAKSDLWYTQDGELLELRGSLYPIGGTQYRTTKVFEEKILPLTAGTRFYLTTDGFKDQFGGHFNKKYLKRRLKELIHTHAHLDFNTQKVKIATEFEEWQGLNIQTDDVLVVGLEV
ncbi:MAG: SpoIIE family protein phosphatase [Microscillaceae bacterium]|jgi:serine phosphatase RsbU (regulator of sigma subunit)|nr:SpoIIE family protein phosphatase [Microscillaceae bacterium]